MNAVERISKYKNVVVLSPLYDTGGPEAIHQLVDAMNQLGINSYICYYSGRKGETMPSLEVTEKEVKGVNQFSATDPFRLIQLYQPRILDTVPLDGVFLIVPEVMAHLALRKLNFNNVAIWWLSVDNSPFALNDSNPELALLSTFRGIHLAQSEYASQTLKHLGVRKVYPLTDYLSPIYLNHVCDKAATVGQQSEPNPVLQRQGIAYFPRKGGALAARFFQNAPSWCDETQKLKIEGMSRPQVIATFEKAAIYLDFGHHPGKDRVPREAALLGAVVFVHDQGSARFIEDVPLDDYYRFHADDVADGTLWHKVERVLANLTYHRQQQAMYHESILAEQAKFHAEIRRLFMQPRL